MPMISMETFEQSGLEAPKPETTAAISALNQSFHSKISPENGAFGKIDGLAEIIKKETGWSDEISKAISSPEEYKVLKEAGLKEYDINGKRYLFKTDIDWNQTDEYGRTNTERIENDFNPIAKNGQKIEYHHVGQGKDAPIAELTASEHNKIPVNSKIPSEVRPDGDNIEWNKQRRYLLKMRLDATLVQKPTFVRSAQAGHETGVKSGLAAAGLTAAISTAENVRGYMNGEITAKEAFTDAGKDVGAATALGYGTGFISEAVANAAAKSSRNLISALGRANVPASVIAFAIDSHDSVVDYAQGNIDGEKLAADLGKSATGVAGSIGGSALAGAAAGSVIPGAGTLAGTIGGVAVSLVGGMVGYAVASEAYATALEAAMDGTAALAEKTETAAAASGFDTVSTAVAENAEVLKDKTVEMGKSVIDNVAASAPEALGTVAAAMNDFAASLKLPIHF